MCFYLAEHKDRGMQGVTARTLLVCQKVLNKNKNMNQFLHEALTEETPGKVMGLLGAALFSLALMLGVSMSDMSFNKMYSPIPDPFGPSSVISAFDHFSAGYSSLVNENFLQPLAQDYKVYADNLGFIAQESGLAYFFGFDEGDTTPVYASRPQVAGARIVNEAVEVGFSVNTLYDILIK